MLCGLRAPIGIIAVFGMAMTNSFFMCTVFGGVVKDDLKVPLMPWDPDFDEKDPYKSAYNQRTAMNWLGAINYAAVD